MAVIAPIVAGVSALHAEVVQIVALRDNTLFQDANGDTSNGAGPAFFAGRNGQNLTRRGLLRFDVASNVPVGAILDSVRLRLWVSAAPNETDRVFTLHRVLQDWGEGTSSTGGGSGAPATPMDATWIHTFYPGSFWDTEGGKFVAPGSASQVVAGVGAYSWRGGGMNADVLGWLLDPGTNFGWLIRGEETGPSTVRRFDSREATTADQRPELSVYFSIPSAVDESRTPLRGLGPVFPNPTRENARAALVLMKEGDARAWVEDIAGRRVASLLTGHIASGRHELVWNGCSESGRRAAPGIYVLRVVIRGHPAEQRRFAIIR